MCPRWSYTHRVIKPANTTWILAVSLNIPINWHIWSLHSVQYLRQGIEAIISRQANWKRFFNYSERSFLEIGFEALVQVWLGQLHLQCTWDNKEKKKTTHTHTHTHTYTHAWHQKPLSKWHFISSLESKNSGEGKILKEVLFFYSFIHSFIAAHRDDSDLQLFY